MRAIKKHIRHTKAFLKKLRKMRKKDYYQNKLKLWENSIKNKWKVMKKLLVKTKRKMILFPSK